MDPKCEKCGQPLTDHLEANSGAVHSPERCRDIVVNQNVNLRRELQIARNEIARLTPLAAIAEGATAPASPTTFTPEPAGAATKTTRAAKA